MALECLLKKQYSTKSDVYAFDVLCIEMLTRKPSYPNMKMAEFALRVISEKLNLRNDIPEDASTYLSEMILKCFETIPENRLHFDNIVKILRTNK